MIRLLYMKTDGTETDTLLPDDDFSGGEKMTNSELKSMLRRSPQEAHRALLNDYGSYVYAIVYNRLRSCGSAEDIEECVSDAFAELFLAIDKGEISNVKAFLGTIAKRIAIDRFRSLSGRTSRTVYIDEDNMQELASDFNVENMSDRNELRRILLDQIEALGEPDSTILIQKFYYNKTSAEIAETVSMNASSVRSRSSIFAAS